MFANEWQDINVLRVTQTDPAYGTEGWPESAERGVMLRVQHTYICLISYCDTTPMVRGNGVITGEGWRRGTGALPVLDKLLDYNCSNS